MLPVTLKCTLHCSESVGSSYESKITHLLKTYRDFRGKEKYNAILFDFSPFEFGTEIITVTGRSDEKSRKDSSQGLCL